MRTSAIARQTGPFITRDAVGDNDAIAIPLGTPLFKRYLAPPDTHPGGEHPAFNEGVRLHG